MALNHVDHDLFAHVSATDRSLRLRCAIEIEGCPRM
jgi:hypothetical protein